ncbi:hypothetical protein ACVBEQ_18795 [Nakamurella sp. GG22]
MNATSVGTQRTQMAAREHAVMRRIQRAVHHRTGDTLGKLIVVSLLLTTIAVLFVIVAVARVRGLSAIDEYTHLDWVYQLMHGNLPADGDTVAPKVLADWACLGQWNAQLPPCGQAVDAGQFPNGGQQYNAFHLPLYYLITAGLVEFGQLFVGDQRFVTLAQLTGALWLSAGLVMMYVACRVWRVRTLYAIAAPLLLMSLPRVITASTIVTDDAPAMLAGAYSLYYLGRFRISRSVHLLVPALLTALFAATKVLNALPMFMIAAGLGWFALTAFARRQPRTGWLRLRASVVLVGPSAAMYLVWSHFQALRAQPGWVNPVIGVNTETLVRDPLTSWITSLVKGFDLLADVNLVPELRSRYLVAWNTAVTIPLIAAALLALVLHRRGNRRRWPAILLFAGCALFPLIVEVQALGMGEVPQYFPGISARYGISLVPIAVFCLATVADTLRLRRTTIVVATLGVLILGGTVFGLLPL